MLYETNMFNFIQFINYQLRISTFYFTFLFIIHLLLFLLLTFTPDQ